jgi:hypothetical protein
MQTSVWSSHSEWIGTAEGDFVGIGWAPRRGHLPLKRTIQYVPEARGEREGFFPGQAKTMTTVKLMRLTVDPRRGEETTAAIAWNAEAGGSTAGTILATGDRKAAQGVSASMTVPSKACPQA